MFDCAIIGTGPAGLSAALTLKSLNKSIIWFGNKDLSAKVNKAEKIRNYPGLSMISGKDMNEAFLKQINEMNIEITNKTVTGVYDMQNHYGILCNQEMFEAKTIILATGVEATKPIKGELENVGMGVSYCATCDGFLYKDKVIAVVCTSSEYEHEIEYLSSVASKVFLYANYKNCNISLENVEIVNGFPKQIVKDGTMMMIITSDYTLDVDGIFMLKSSISPAVLVPGLKEEDGHVVVDRMCQTNLKGCFAAGDITGRPYQYAKAVGEGNVAAHSVVKYLSQLK